ncbi:MAG: 2-oxoacid:acceptor oxidoreductase family protein [Candidatus Riflebacteria bacterium]|nr:2-oxoacid:acceptor oxidoreductase family protein [Candidatus Riflebacteria bacterium]
MKKVYEIRFSGSGGQGIITAGMVLGEAASVFDGKYVVQTQSYGPEARGGACKTELMIADERVSYPKPELADILLVMSQASYDKYIDEVKEDAWVIVDSSTVKYKPARGVFPVPITKLAEEVVGNKVVANVVAMGVLSSLTNIVSYEALERSLLNRIPRGTEEMNKKALKLGKTLEFKDNV